MIALCRIMSWPDSSGELSRSAAAAAALIPAAAITGVPGPEEQEPGEPTASPDDAVAPANDLAAAAEVAAAAGGDVVTSGCGDPELRGESVLAAPAAGGVPPDAAGLLAELAEAVAVAAVPGLTAPGRCAGGGPAAAAACVALLVLEVLV